MGFYGVVCWGVISREAKNLLQMLCFYVGIHQAPKDGRFDGEVILWKLTRLPQP